MSPSNVDSEMDQKFYDELTKCTISNTYSRIDRIVVILGYVDEIGITYKYNITIDHNERKEN